MNILYRWLNDDKSIMQFIFQPQAQWDDFYDVLFNAFDEMHTVNHPVDVIIDLSRMSTFPSQTIKELHYLAELKHVNFRFRLLISQNPLMHIVYSAFNRIYPASSGMLCLCATMEEAYTFIDLRARPSN